MELLKGLPVAKAINEELINEREKTGVVPKLAIIRVGEREDDLAYERGALKKMEKVGFDAEVFAFPKDIDNEDFQKEFDKINENPDIDGILLLRPLPKQLDEKAVTLRIDPKKDIDGIGPMNLYKVFAGESDGYAPCTAEAVIEILDHYGIDVKGKAVTVVGRSLVIGKPVAMMLMKKNGTVTICHTKTADMRGVCKGADIVVAAAGQAKMIDASFLNEGTVVIDVGINTDEEGNLCGDVDASSVEAMEGMLTPVPGGVGSVTTSVLAKHLLKAALNKR